MKSLQVFSILTLLLLVSIINASGQGISTISGVVSSEEGHPLPDVMIYLDGDGQLTSKDGTYSFSVPFGRHTLSLVALEYINQQVEVDVQEGKSLKMDFQMVHDSGTLLDEVEISGRSVVEEIKASPFNVVAVDTKVIQNTSMNLTEALERSAGLRVRRSGGLGSRASVMINGFRGRQIRIFMDGMPMENFGSAFRMNNIPVNLADRIEVYKGVVPVELGADALGGAINIVTKKSNSTFVDASYSYGSFNTHKSNISAGTTSKSGMQFSVNAFQNYSDNNYKVLTQTLEFDTAETGGVSATFSDESYWFERFHDAYHNESVIAKLGFVQKKWADRITLAATYAQEYREIQNANILQIVFGGKHTQSRSVIPSLAYAKQDLGLKNLSLRVVANYSRVKRTNVDTLAGQFNWRGQYYRAENASRGEANYTFSNFFNNSGNINTNLNYVIATKHTLSLNNVWSSFVRSTIDEKQDDADDPSQSFERKNTKNVTGLSYHYRISDKWLFGAFGKLYQLRVSGPVRLATVQDEYVIEEENYNTTGYGLLASHQLTNAVLLKLSGEKAVKLPSANELFGDQILENSAQSLRPETSRNINFNFIYQPKSSSTSVHDVMLDAGFIFRDTRNFIRRDISSADGTATSINHGKVRTLGLDLEARYYFRNRWSAGGSFSYQNITNQEAFDELGRDALNYKDPMKNEPILYFNADLGYIIPDVFNKNNRLSVNYFINFLQEYYRGWKSIGADQVIIPQQLSYDARITYTMQGGRYNVSLEAYNITDETLYDRFSLQRPGRRFVINFRYALRRFKNKNE